MADKISDWDPSEYLDSPEMIQEYLQVMLEENGVDGFKRALGHVAKAKGMTEIARSTHLGRQNLYKSLSEDGSPQFETVFKVLGALGLKFEVKASREDSAA